MPKDTDLSDLIINKLTQAQFQALVNAGTVSETELYMITDADVDVTVDDNSITKNSQNQIQTVGVINQNNTTVANKNWVGTRAEYDALVADEDIDDNTIYTITDDENIPVSILELLYPVGAIYIGTMATCPLQLLGIGTWQLKATDRVLQGAGTRGSVGSTVNESLPNITGNTITSTVSNSPEGGSTVHTNTVDGAFRKGNAFNSMNGGNAMTMTSYAGTFDASRCSSTYQNNAPVQQDAYLVNIWERIL